MATPNAIVTYGFGAPGSISLIVTRGFGIGDAVIVTASGTDAQRLAIRPESRRLSVRPDGRRMAVRS